MKTALLIVSAILLLSLLGNYLQWRSAEKEKIARMIEFEKSNTTIAGKKAEIAQKQDAIESIHKQRTSDSVSQAKETSALKAQIKGYQKKLEVLPKTVVYNPDSATVDSLRVAFHLKDSVISTQALMITHLEVEKTGLFASFNKEISELKDQKAAQVVIANSLQDQLVTEQANTRREKRKKGFWRTVSAVAVGGIAVLLLSPK